MLDAARDNRRVDAMGMGIINDFRRGERFALVQVEILRQERFCRKTVRVTFLRRIRACQVQVVRYPGAFGRKVPELQVAELVEQYEPEIIQPIVAECKGNDGASAFPEKHGSIEIRVRKVLQDHKDYACLVEVVTRMARTIVQNAQRDKCRDEPVGE